MRYLAWLLPLTAISLTVLAWRRWLRPPRANQRGRGGVLAMALLVVPMLTVPVFVWLRVIQVVSLTPGFATAVAGGFCSIAAFIASWWAPHRFRGIALLACLAWVVFFAMALLALISVAGLPQPLSM